MRIIACVIIFVCISKLGLSQKIKAFEGKIVYQVELLDSIGHAPISSSFMTIYTNDTLVRLEATSNQLGEQITIRHLILNKYYILLQVESGKFAIQHTVPLDTLPTKYHFKKKFGSKKFDGKKAKKMLVSGKNYPQAVAMYYFKDINPKFVEAIKGIPGLPVDYYLYTEDGIYHYKLISFRETEVDKNLFGIPLDYKKVSFDEFMENMMQKN